MATQTPEEKKRARRLTSKRIRHRNKAYVNTYLDKTGCQAISCEEKKLWILDFHHIDPSEKEGQVREMANSCRSVQSLQEEMDKCVVLCSNCHRTFHTEERFFGMSPSIKWEK